MATLLMIAFLITSLSVALASSSQLYIDDIDFDFDLDSLETSADSYDGFSQAFDYNAEDNQAENVAVYVAFGTFLPSGELRVYVDTSNELNTTLPPATVTVPDGSSDIADLSGGIEVFTEAGKSNNDVGIKLTVASMNVDDVMAKYMDTLTGLDYAITPIAGSSKYTVSKKYANYIMSFKQAGSGVEVAINGM